jgi:SNF2 family DNA or RNA helicase
MPGDFALEVTSGIDWFDLSGGVRYADQIVPLPVLLQAMRAKENFVRLDDGSHGMMPTQWVEKFGRLFELADHQGDSLRFGRPQALLLDALLAEQDPQSQVLVDSAFKKLRREMTRFQGIREGQVPAGFNGKLRRYQRESLGWFQFLQKFGFGGCLADDMGLGKTVQVLALLEQRRLRRMPAGQPRKPSLVVVPKSLVFNWMDEAGRFTPRLNMVDFTGPWRGTRVDQLASADVVLTTYGTLRKDIQRLAAMEFDYAILDEAQAIKNSATDAAKACYLIRADHRLAMTGTPIENHLGDLWSQFRFLNPGLLGHSQAFAAFNRSDCDQESLQRLSQAVRPFILRRTKQQVLKELPKKTEQTMICEMSPAQSRQYNELRDHFRLKLDKTVAQLGIRRAAIHVLDALLRLRQAACDGRLVNPTQGARGAKLDLLLEQLEEVTGEGHKVLIFSQFTKLLALLQQDLRRRKLRFEYLDGKTRDRKACVQRFQNDPKCPLFLISLKAGGHGLNLTAADYVYILDPWWNPAVEAQAVDRAHRMGQRKQVFAYRMITKGTVEEKILELQKSKRALAESIIAGNNSLIRNLTADDLQLLLAR